MTSNINELQQMVIALQIENDDLKKEQKQFQDLLVKKITAINQLGWWKRITGYAKLVTDLIETIMKTVDETKAKG